MKLDDSNQCGGGWLDCDLDDKPEVRPANKMNSTDTMMSGIRT